MALSQSPLSNLALGWYQFGKLGCSAQLGLVAPTIPGMDNGMIGLAGREVTVWGSERSRDKSPSLERRSRFKREIDGVVILRRDNRKQQLLQDSQTRHKI